MMGLFSRVFQKKQSFFIDGREIEIIDRTKSKGENANVYSMILKVCRKERIAAYFPKITFIIRVWSSVRIAEVSSSDLKRGEFVIGINLRLFRNAEDKVRYAIIVHEIAHLWHDFVSKELQRNSKYANRLAKGVRKSVSLPRRDTDLREIRQFLSYVFSGVFYEGIAEYCGLLSVRKFVFDDNTFGKTYRMAGYEAKKVERCWQSIMHLVASDRSKELVFDRRAEVRKLFALLRELMYTLGFHLVYTILYLDHDMTLEKLAKMSPFKFVRHYENCMRKNRFDPLFSATSGKGILDYKRMVNQWWAMVQSKKK